MSVPRLPAHPRTGRDLPVWRVSLADVMPARRRAVPPAVAPKSHAACTLPAEVAGFAWRNRTPRVPVSARPRRFFATGGQDATSHDLQTTMTFGTRSTPRAPFRLGLAIDPDGPRSFGKGVMPVRLRPSPESDHDTRWGLGLPRTAIVAAPSPLPGLAGSSPTVRIAASAQGFTTATFHRDGHPAPRAFHASTVPPNALRRRWTREPGCPAGARPGLLFGRFLQLREKASTPSTNEPHRPRGPRHRGASTNRARRFDPPGVAHRVEGHSIRGWPRLAPSASGLGRDLTARERGNVRRSAQQTKRWADCVRAPTPFVTRPVSPVKWRLRQEEGGESRHDRAGLSAKTRPVGRVTAPFIVGPGFGRAEPWLRAGFW